MREARPERKKRRGTLSSPTPCLAASQRTQLTQLAGVFATTTVAAITTTATAARTIFTRARFIDCERAAIDIFAIERLDGCVGSFLALHRDKAEAARAAAEFVH